MNGRAAHASMKTRGLALLTLLLLGLPAYAQPGPIIYFVEHDWTVRIGEARFGLYQVRLIGDENYGAGRHTTLYFGRAILKTKTRTFQRTTWQVLALAAIALGVLFVVRREAAKTGPNQPAN